MEEVENASLLASGLRQSRSLLIEEVVQVLQLPASGLGLLFERLHIVLCSRGIRKHHFTHRHTDECGQQQSEELTRPHHSNPEVAARGREARQQRKSDRARHERGDLAAGEKDGFDLAEETAEGLPEASEGRLIEQPQESERED